MNNRSIPSPSRSSLCILTGALRRGAGGPLDEAGRNGFAAIAASVLTLSLLTAAVLMTAGAPAALAAGESAPAGAVSASATPEGSTFTALDLPDWVILDPEKDAAGRPWILVIDDPQCPYCMQLHLALIKAKEQKDPEITGAVLARLPFPLAYHDQSAHIVNDAFCLEASRKGHSWSAASYLDWLIVEPWLAEPEWKTLTIEDLGKEDGFFDQKYDAHRVTSSRRRDYQTAAAREEASCPPELCKGDEDCAKICASEKTCKDACPAKDGGADAKTGGNGETQSRDKCLAACTDRFVSARYRQFSKVHSACLLEGGPKSVTARTAAAFAWAIEHKVPGTPTVYVGNPSIGFRTLGDADHLADFMELLRKGLVETRQRMALAKGAGR